MQIKARNAKQAAVLGEMLTFHANNRKEPIIKVQELGRHDPVELDGALMVMVYRECGDGKTRLGDQILIFPSGAVYHIPR